MNRKPLKANAHKFIYGDKPQENTQINKRRSQRQSNQERDKSIEHRPELDVEQDFEQQHEQRFEQTAAQRKPKGKAQPNALACEILPEAQFEKEDTQRLCVDLPKSLAQKVSKLAKQSGVPKTEIVRRLLIKATE